MDRTKRIQRYMRRHPVVYIDEPRKMAFEHNRYWEAPSYCGPPPTLMQRLYSRSKPHLTPLRQRMDFDALLKVNA
jgi:hypothetical protein